MTILSVFKFMLPNSQGPTHNGKYGSCFILKYNQNTFAITMTYFEVNSITQFLYTCFRPIFMTKIIMEAFKVESSKIKKYKYKCLPNQAHT